MDAREERTGVRVGADVVGADGKRIGAVAAVRANVLAVTKGRNFPTHYFIPRAAVVSADDAVVHVATTKDQVRDRWG